LLPHVAITNSYGPTETSIGVIFHEYDSEDPHSMAIGRPIANVKAVVVDGELKLRPIGAVGELCIGGACVGLGYLSNPELTKQKFIINPFPELGCSTLYRTGDLVRYRSNGVLEFLGRIDDQVKIHGIRIEPSEIEAALMGHPLIAEALVICTNDQQGVKQLVAYVCSHDINVQLKQSVLRQFLMGELPRYMIPTTFVQVPALPLTSGGKLNRTPHEILHARVLNDQRTYVAPRNIFETQIVEMWIEILGQKNIGINDHFFSDLGGDSLSGILFVARFKSQTGIDLDILTLYEYSTPALFTEYLMKEQNTVKLIPPSHSNYSIFKKQRLYVSNWRGRQSKPDSFLFTLNETGINPTLFWCFQGYEEFHELSKRLGTSQPITGMRSGHQIMQYTDENIEALAFQYAGEMMQLQTTGAFIIGGNCQGAVIAEATARVLIASGRLVSLLILMEHSDLKPYNGQVAFIFGRDSRLNPYRDQADSVILFKQRLPKDYTVDFIDGAHGDFFSKKNLSSLSNVLTNLLASISR
jgi:acyl carrier protein